MKILVVEDEQKVSSFIKQGLELNGFNVDISADGISALRVGSDNQYDAIIMDINLPGLSGFEVCKKLREQNVLTPILILTALGTTREKVHGFSLGADDYLVKPFEFEELLARIKAITYRAQAKPMFEQVLKIADLELDSDKKIVKRGGKHIDLTAKEFMLLEYMMRNQGKVLSRSDIAEKIWDITFDTGTNVIDLYIFYLRKKIDKDFSPKLIHTQVGMGYVLMEK